MASQKSISAYQWTVILVGSLICVLSLQGIIIARIDLRFLFLTFATLAIGSRITIPIPRVKGLISVSDTFIFLAILLFGREAAVLLAASEGLCSSVRFSRKPVTILFNSAVMACSTWLAVTTLKLLLGGVPLNAPYSPNLIIGLSLLACMQYVSNSGIVSVCAALRTGQPFWKTWNEGFLWTSLTYFAGAFAAGIISQLIASYGFYALVATTPIILVIYLTYTTYLKNIEASKSQAEQAERHVAALRESEERFRSAFDHAAGMALVAPGGRWIQVNKSLCEILGYSEEELLTRDFQSVTHPGDLNDILQQLRRLGDQTVRSFQIEQRFVHKNGDFKWILLSATAVNDGQTDSPNLIFQIQDITDRKLAEQTLVYNAFHDALTGLPNRVRFMDHLKQSVERGRRKKHSPFAVLFLDFDRFKLINDSLGHMVGDQLLVDIAGRLKAAVRPGDTVARMGGDEFTILLDDLNSAAEAEIVATRLLRNLAQPFELTGREIFITASIGIALSTLGYRQAEDVLRDADTAMYRAKTLGKARYEVFDRTMHLNAVNQLHMETDLWRAIERKELTLDYQPIISFLTGKIAGFEALLRWQHPARGIVSPPEFISVAEETGLIVPIGEWVLKEACQQIQRWQELSPQTPPLYVSVNLSAKQFMQQNLPKVIRLVLDNAGCLPSSLKVEITESMVMHNVDAAAKTLQDLCEMGIEISLDDFGTGYSSLSYLHRFPLSMLKVDRSFVSSMTENAENLEIIRTIVALARNLKMGVIAEGVETLDQFTQLQALNCDYGQGYFFSHALNALNATKLLSMGGLPEAPPPATESIIDYDSVSVA
ncbi:MAG TPA: EAL domain-containing protein [Pyrinomonadaceae bacterium]|nr:EAL domain-containing protein [Pyrinomonadaceae bacterium]